MAQVPTGHRGPFAETLPETQTILLPTGRTTINPDNTGSSSGKRSDEADKEFQLTRTPSRNETAATTATFPGREERKPSSTVQSHQAWSEQDRMREVHGWLLALERERGKGAMEFTEILQGI